MDRRTFMTSGAWLSSTAAGGAWPWLAQAGVRRHTLAIVDLTLAQGAAFADHARRLALPLFEPGDDIGTLWYTTLAPLLGRASLKTQPSLIGLTRASDYFVLHQLATRAGYLVKKRDEAGTASVSSSAHVAFVCAAPFATHPRR